MNQALKNALKMTVAAFVTTALFACDEKSAPEVVATESTSEQSVLARTRSPDGARVFFISPADGATLSNPVSIEFGIASMDVVRAGDNKPDSGHHHLLIDTGLPDLGLPIPADAQHVHFGDGSTATEITLSSGEHTLQLLLGDHLHIPHDPRVVSKTISITVE
jgi:hypothetical protein